MTTDEFAADSVAWIMTSLMKLHRDIVLPQRDAKCQACEPAADNGDWNFVARDSSGLMARNENMAEESGPVFRELPVIAVRPQCGKLSASEARAHTDHRIVTRHIVASQCPQHATAKHRPCGASRFDGDEYLRPQRNQTQQFHKLRVLEMM